jgi:hypothetical protein
MDGARDLVGPARDGRGTCGSDIELLLAGRAGLVLPVVGGLVAFEVAGFERIRTEVRFAFEQRRPVGLDYARDLDLNRPRPTRADPSI